MSTSGSKRSGSGLRKNLLTIVLGTLAIGGGILGFGALAALKQPPAQREVVEKIYNVEVYDAELSNLQEILSAFGTARADREVVLSAQVAGEVVEIHPRLKVGQAIEPPRVTVGESGQSRRLPGDLLLRVDPKTYRERVTKAENQIAEDRADLDRLLKEKENNEGILKKARQDVTVFQEEYKRIKSLYDRKAASKRELMKVQLELQRYETLLLSGENENKLFPLRDAQIRRRIETHRSELELAKFDLGRTEIRPPFAGILSEVVVEQGQFVRVGDRLVRLTDVSKVEIPVALTLKDYAKIEKSVQAGESPRVELAENETDPPRWTGLVLRVAPEVDESTRTVNVFVQVDNDSQPVPLLPGTFVHARIAGPILRKILVIPRDAILNGTVYVARNGRVRRLGATVIQTLQSLAIVEIAGEEDDGLAPGDKVILTNLDVIHDGAAVKIQSHRSLTDELKNQRTQIARPALAGGGSAETK